MRLVFHPEFRASLHAAMAHYAGISEALATRFSDEVFHGVQQIACGMVNYAVGPHGFRCYRCKRFPFLVYYEQTDNVATVLALVHAHERPGALKVRLG